MDYWSFGVARWLRLIGRVNKAQVITHLITKSDGNFHQIIQEIIYDENDKCRVHKRSAMHLLGFGG